VYKALAADEGIRKFLKRGVELDEAELQGMEMTITLDAASVLAMCRNFQDAEKLHKKHADPKSASADKKAKKKA
jgi:hypothetical protein